LQNEKTYLMLTVPAVSTVTFFEGDIKIVHKNLKYKVSDIINKNPWLTGRLR